METLYASQFDVSERPDMPLTIDQELLELLTAEQHESVKRSGQQAKQAQQVLDAHRKAEVHLMGSDNYTRYRAFVAERRAARLSRLAPPEGPNLPDEERARLRAEDREEAGAFLARAGVDTGELERFKGRVHDELSAVTQPPPADVVFRRADPSAEFVTANPWQVSSPPYLVHHQEYTGFRSGFGYKRAHYTDAGTGSVGSYLHFSDKSASSFDLVYMTCSSQVLIGYLMPITGLLHVRVEAQCGSSHHHLTREDEFGLSSSKCRQDQYLSMQAGVSPPRYALMSWFEATGNTDGHWDQHYLQPGDTYWVDFFSELPYAKGTMAWAWVGNHNYSYARADDMEMYTSSECKWFLRRIGARSTGED